MQVCLVKRGKVTHCGLRLNSDDKTYEVSVCSGLWTCDDKTSIGDSGEVTCKRCLKILATADENGVVDLPRNKK